MDIFSLLFSYRGRIGRLTYFWTTFAISVAFFAAIALAVSAHLNESIDFTRSASVLAPGLVAILVVTWISGAVTTKRFHDIGHSGWMTAVLLVVMAIPFLDVIAVWPLGQLFLKAGDAGRNAYGPAPGSVGAAAFGDDISPDARQSRAFAAIDALAQTGGVARPPAPVEKIAPPPRALPAPSAGGQRSAGFGRRQNAPT